MYLDHLWARFRQKHQAEWSFQWNANCKSRPTQNKVMRDVECCRESAGWAVNTSSASRCFRRFIRCKRRCSICWCRLRFWKVSEQRIAILERRCQWCENVRDLVVLCPGNHCHHKAIFWGMGFLLAEALQGLTYSIQYTAYTCEDTSTLGTWIFFPSSFVVSFGPPVPLQGFFFPAAIGLRHGLSGELPFISHRYLEVLEKNSMVRVMTLAAFTDGLRNLTPFNNNLTNG